jgi:hypothetical protein
MLEWRLAVSNDVKIEKDTAILQWRKNRRKTYSAVLQKVLDPEDIWGKLAKG